MAADGIINQEQAEIFLSVHAKLDDSGLMQQLHARCLLPISLFAKTLQFHRYFHTR